MLVISNVILNRGNDDQVVDMGDATLPRVSFMMGGQKINALSGYVDDMDIAAMRDTITPLESDGTLKMQIEKMITRFVRSVTVYILWMEQRHMIKEL